MNIVEKAKDFALRYHGDQDHGCVKIVDHLTAVTDKLKQVLGEIGQEKYVDEIIAAGWLHDVIEDTPVNHNELNAIFGSFIGDMVQAVTDGEGANRMERHLNTYWRTRVKSYATLVKMCDRWHNHQRSIDNNESFVTMYAKEYTYFKFALYVPGMADVLWGELDSQYQKMIEIIKK